MNGCGMNVWGMNVWGMNVWGMNVWGMNVWGMNVWGMNVWGMNVSEDVANMLWAIDRVCNLILELASMNILSVDILGQIIIRVNSSNCVILYYYLC